jgi:hypothetical protein
MFHVTTGTHIAPAIAPASHGHGERNSASRCVVARNSNDAADAHDDAENNEDSDDVLAHLLTLEAFGISVLS